MRALLMGAAALVSWPLHAQDHSGHTDHTGHTGHASKTDRASDSGHAAHADRANEAGHAAHADRASDPGQAVHAGHSAHEAPEVDHCAMGHLPPEQCPPKGASDDAHAEHGAKSHSRTQAEPEMDHAQHGVVGQAGHAGMDHSAHGGSQDKSAPGAAPEHALPDRALEGPRHAADLIWGAEVMAPARAQLRRENGDFRTGSVMIERLEARFASDGGETGYVWDAQAWYGGDLDRVVLKSEGEGEFGHEIEDAEVQALYSRAITPFFDLQAGVRYDPVADDRTHFVIGLQGLAPYMLHVDGALFLSDRGDLTARIEAEYDQKITQRLILQPRIEIEASAQDIASRETAAGLTKIEPGLRMRYEIAQEFAPYLGIEYEAKLGGTASLARAAGQDPDGFKILAGIRAWF